MRHLTTVVITVLAASLLLAISMLLALILYWPRVLPSWDSAPPSAAPARFVPIPNAPLPAAVPQPRPAGNVPDDEVDTIEEDWNDPTMEEEEMDAADEEYDEDTTGDDEDV